MFLAAPPRRAVAAVDFLRPPPPPTEIDRRAAADTMTSAHSSTTASRGVHAHQSATKTRCYKYFVACSCTSNGSRDFPLSLWPSTQILSFCRSRLIFQALVPRHRRRCGQVTFDKRFCRRRTPSESAVI